MAIQWQWDDKIGEAVIQQTVEGETKEYRKNIYGGNCFMIFLNEWDEGEHHMYSLYTFFADERHAKICLGLDRTNQDIGNILDDGVNKLVKLRINKKKCHIWKKIVTLFAQAFDNIDIEIYTEENEKHD